MNLLTTSSMASFRRCPRHYYHRYELGLTRISTGTALRVGTAFHLAMELRGKGATMEEASESATSLMADLPYELETLRQLIAAYWWRYSIDTLKMFDIERVFRMSLTNPETGKNSKSFQLAGKIDAIAQLPDGRMAIVEYKTAGEDISPDSNYWLRLRCDPQISLYVVAGRYLGYDISTVIYDVTRKPTISPFTATPQEKRKYTKQGTLYANQREHDETPDEFGLRLVSDISERPDYYFQRREVPRLHDDLREFAIDAWNQAKQMYEAKKHGRWFRNVSRFTCDGCEFADICLNCVQVNPEYPPSGFERHNNKHRELGDIQND